MPRNGLPEFDLQPSDKRELSVRIFPNLDDAFISSPFATIALSIADKRGQISSRRAGSLGEDGQGAFCIVAEFLDPDVLLMRREAQGSAGKRS